MAAPLQREDRMTPKEFAAAPLSAVIRAALDDLAEVEADPRYVVDMNKWHGPVKGGDDGQ